VWAIDTWKNGIFLGSLENYVISSTKVYTLCVDQELSMWVEACLKVCQVVMPSS
jgi:hypothetical protein